MPDRAEERLHPAVEQLSGRTEALMAQHQAFATSHATEMDLLVRLFFFFFFCSFLAISMRATNSVKSYASVQRKDQQSAVGSVAMAPCDSFCVLDNLPKSEV